ncbi:MAG: hypothetical protein KUG61_06930 [Parvibaculaceae bacterium]|nr:hypothetical protein [Parvibaculaceae bacterium]
MAKTDQSPKKLILGITLSACTLLSACGPSFSGPVLPVRLAHIDGGTSPHFICTQDGELDVSTVSNDTDITKFNLAYQFSKTVCASIRDTKSSEESTAMLEAGFTLVKTRCNDFFYQKGRSQSQARLTRSLIAPITVALTGIAGLADVSNSAELLTGLSIGSAFVISGLEIYEEQFLFDADNINSVRQLTTRALAAHSKAVLDKKPENFDKAVRHLISHQMICTPANILELTQKAIEKGIVKPRIKTGDAVVQIEEAGGAVVQIEDEATPQSILDQNAIRIDVDD